MVLLKKVVISLSKFFFISCENSLSAFFLNYFALVKAKQNRNAVLFLVKCSPESPKMEHMNLVKQECFLFSIV